MRQKGFTLVEIVLVIALIGVSATAIITLVDPVTQFKKSNDAKRKADLRQIQAAFEIYRADQGAYPAALPACGGALTGPTGTVYMRKTPCDPRGTGQYLYTYVLGAGSTSYSLFSCLEYVRDPQRDLPPTYTGNNATYCTGGTTNWSYTVTNP